MEPKRTPKWIIALIVIIGIAVTIGPFLVIFIFALNDTSSSFKVKKDGTVSIDKNSVTILSEVKGSYDEEEDCYFIEGTIKNNTDDVRSINVVYNVYDNSNNILGTAEAYLDNLDSNGTWKFKANYCDYASDVSDFKIVSANTYSY